MRPHLNEHCWHVRVGTVPTTYKEVHNLKHCSFCNALIHNRYRDTCPTCRPAAAAARATGALRTQLPVNSTPSLPTERRPNLPTLEEVHSRFVPTLKHIPKELRPLWVRCVSRVAANTAWQNNTETWIETQMLTKAVLCNFPRGGKAHKTQRLAWTRARLKRWLDGEKAELWADLPHYKPPRHKRVSDTTKVAAKQQRCINQCREGGFAAACKSLTKPNPLGHTQTVL